MCTYPYPIGFVIGLVFRSDLGIFIDSHQLNASSIAPHSSKKIRSVFALWSPDFFDCHIYTETSFSELNMFPSVMIGNLVESGVFVRKRIIRTYLHQSIILGLSVFDRSEI